MAVAEILLGALVLLVVLWIISFTSAENPIKRIPGPAPLPIIGNAHQMKTDVLDLLLKFKVKYGSIFKMRIMLFEPSIFTTGLKFVEEVSKSYDFLDKANSYRFSHNWLGTSVLTAAGEKWKIRRKILNPAFGVTVLEASVESFNTFGDILLRKLQSEVKNQSIDIYQHLNLYSLDVICASAMGTNVNAQEELNSEYVHYVREMCRILYHRAFLIHKTWNLTYSLTSDFHLERKALSYLHGFTKNVISSRKQELARNVDVGYSEGIKTKLTLLDTLLKHKESDDTFTDEDIREEVDTFMFAGHDTVGSAVSFTLFCLATNPLVQEKAVQELGSILLNHNAPTYKNLQEMKYLEMVIKETLRLYPPVPLFGRRIAADTEIDGYLFPKGADFNVFVYGIHRDPSLYPDPEKFDPERFSLENLCKRPPYAYIPFSAGPRNCIGQKYAMLEIKAVVSKILMKFELLPAIPEHTLQLTGFIVLKSKNGIRLRLKDRSF